MTSKIFLLDAGENWVCDRFVNEWYDYNSTISTKNILEADIVWILAGWCWNRIPYETLKQKKVILTIHHIVSEKFDDKKLLEFQTRDEIVDRYHVPCQKTKNQLERLTKKPIDVTPFWSNQKLWYSIDDKKSLRSKYGIEESCFLVGSFQRDTEGSDLKSPKLEKGPDLFCDYVERIREDKKNLVVLLAGWRRQYVMSRLKSANIPFYYCELPNFFTLNELYNCLDLYVVAARCEGGPQSIAECSLSKTPIISTNVGLAKKFLHEDSIFDTDWNALPNIDHAYKRIQDHIIPVGFNSFYEVFGKL